MQYERFVGGMHVRVQVWDTATIEQRFPTCLKDGYFRDAKGNQVIISVVFFLLIQIL